jgi:acetyl esterase/lipase
VSFDLPNHGPRRDQFGEGIQGWRNAWVAGEDRLAQAVEEAKAVVGWCVEHGRAEPGRVVVYGISRGGYLALRLLAADPRIAAAAAIAPVTDWRDLAEFSAEKGRQDLAALTLTRYATALAGKRIFVVIGNADDRVSTLSCCRLFLALEEANAGAPRHPSPVEFHCAPMSQPGHVVDDSWRKLAADFLLGGAEATPGYRAWPFSAK